MEAPAQPSPLRRWSPLWTSLAAVALFTAAVAAITSIALDDQAFHFALYVSVAVPALLLVVAAAWLWPRPSSQLGTVARLGILAGLALFGLGNALEAVGVWGWSWNGSGRYVVANRSLAQTHDLGGLGSAVGEALLVVGVVLVVADVARRRRSAGGSARPGNRHRHPTADQRCPMVKAPRSSQASRAGASRVTCHHRRPAGSWRLSDAARVVGALAFGPSRWCSWRSASSGTGRSSPATTTWVRACLPTSPCS